MRHCCDCGIGENWIGEDLILLDTGEEICEDCRIEREVKRQGVDRNSI